MGVSHRSVWCGPCWSCGSGRFPPLGAVRARPTGQERSPGAGSHDARHRRTKPRPAPVQRHGPTSESSPTPAHDNTIAPYRAARTQPPASVSAPASPPCCAPTPGGDPTNPGRHRTRRDAPTGMPQLQFDRGGSQTAWPTDPYHPPGRERRRRDHRDGVCRCWSCTPVDRGVAFRGSAGFTRRFLGGELGDPNLGRHRSTPGRAPDTGSPPERGVTLSAYHR